MSSNCWGVYQRVSSASWIFTCVYAKSDTVILMHYFVLILSFPKYYWTVKTLLSSRESEQRAGGDAGSGGPWGDRPEQPKWAGGLLAGGEGHAAGKAGGCWEETGESEPYLQLEGGPPPGKGLTYIRVHFHHLNFKCKVSSQSKHSLYHFEQWIYSLQSYWIFKLT